MTTCLRCGRTNRSIARFCIDCNTSLPGAVPEPDAEDAEFAEPGETRQESTTLAFGLAGAFTQTLVDPAAERRTRPTDHALPEGTMIEGFRIVRTIGEGGFGIVYLAWDAALERHVAIKEYMPSSLAVRSDAQYSVSVRSERYRDTFDAGLRSFVNEARLLARFDHPALVKVLRFWEANRTAYMAMPWYEGPTLKQTLAELKGRSTDEQLRAWLHPLLDALAVIHQENCFHRDISPDNILLTATGPVLLDFGAARRAINDMTQAMTAVLKPGFAPIEQYGGDMLQGPWTDLYALGGVVHYAITGRPPPASVLRAVEDKLEPLSASHAGRFSRDLLAAVDNALAVRPEARPQDVAAFRAMLGAPSPLPRASGTMVRPGAVAADFHAPERAPSKVRFAMLASLVLAVGVIATFAFGKLRGDTRVASRASAPVEAAAPAPAPAPALSPAPAASASASASAIVTPEPAPGIAAAAPTSVREPVPVPVSMAPAAKPIAPVRTSPAPTLATAAATVQAAVSASSPPPQRTKVASADLPAPSHSEARPQRCADIVQKSSLEPLSPVEVSYLKKECR